MLINKIIPAVAAAAIGASAVMALPGFSPEADASTPPKVVKSDRLDLRPVGAECSPQAWPYYEANCLRDRRQVSRQAKPVRLITADRIATQVKPGQNPAGCGNSRSSPARHSCYHLRGR